jgi:serine/threonine-protein kinase
MAPEQFACEGASVRSDIYALGLILYEASCGKPAFTAANIAELRDQKAAQIPTAPSRIREGVEPLVERLVMRCIERDPHARPASVAHLAAALPGGDPLAAALAAGEIPSPEMVASSGLKEGLRPAVALVLLAFIIIGSLTAMAMNERLALFTRVSHRKPPDVLAELAIEFIKKVGYSGEPADSAFGFDYDEDFLRYLQDTDKTSDRWKKLDPFSPVVFWYRGSPRPLLHLGRLDAMGYPLGVSASEPPLQNSGEALVRLDGEGRLRTFEAIPPQREAASIAPSTAPDWSLLFTEASLDPSRWTPSEPRWNPFYYAETNAAWEGSLPDAPNIPLRIEASAYRGKPVRFEILGPWTRADRPAAVQTGVTIANTIALLILGAFISGGVFFARRNLRLGRGDRRGATRLAVFERDRY